jgi:hypothetical protein
MNLKPAKPAVKRPSTRKQKAKRPDPTHTAIAERAYYISLAHPESDELGNWLRAERELSPA